MKKSVIALLCTLLILASVGCSNSSSINCASCNESFTDTAKFCPKCGLAVAANKDVTEEISCASCNASLADTAKFCPSCGLAVDAPGKTESVRCEHQYVTEVTTEATCSQGGVKTFTCSVCDDSYTESIPVTDHKWEEATCTEPKTCSVCALTEGSPVNHQYTEKIVSTEYLCTEATPFSPATYYYACKYCRDIGEFITYEHGECRDSAWVRGFYVDSKFGDRTDDWYIRPREEITGTFSNSATTNAKLLVEVLYDGAGELEFFLYEYGRKDNVVKNSSSKYSDYYEISIKDEKGNRLDVEGRIPPGGDRVIVSDDDFKEVLSMMKTAKTMRFYIEEEDRPTTQYRFDLDLTDFVLILNYAKENENNG